MSEIVTDEIVPEKRAKRNILIGFEIGQAAKRTPE
jgi:hypothetical protein